MIVKFYFKVHLISLLYYLLILDVAAVDFLAVIPILVYKTLFLHNYKIEFQVPFFLQFFDTHRHQLVAFLARKSRAKIFDLNKKLKKS